MRQSAHKLCFKDLSVQISHGGYLGLSARNDATYVKNLELTGAKVLNLDPNFYKHLDEGVDPQAEQAKADVWPETGQPNMQTQQHFYTDEMEEYQDIFSSHEAEERALDDYMKNNPGNIDDDDDMAEVLYKMNEHLLHILMPVQDFVKAESGMQHYVNDHMHLPKLIASFESLPQSIEDESKFVQTIDYQLQKIIEFYGEVVVKAIDL